MSEYTLPALPYNMDELEPVLSKETVAFHYGKHHAAYVKNLNDALLKEAQAEAGQDLSSQIIIDESVKFNGGGHINHSLYWENLQPIAKGGGKLQEGPLKRAIETSFQSVDTMKEKLTVMSTGLKGSGWGWLGYCSTSKSLCLTTTNIHDLPLAKGIVPLLCIDVWEHAYYLQYKNLRADYIKALWSIVNWSVVEERYKKAIS
jgi:superoxide dismutase, Fe-Mn family